MHCLHWTMSSSTSPHASDLLVPSSCRAAPCLQEEQPHLAQQWHPTHNGTTLPSSVTCGSSVKRWWLCPHSTCNHPHEWEVSVGHCALHGTGCPFCSGHRTCPCNSLAALHPHIAAQWHPTRNGKLSPEEVSPSSNKRVWWRHESPDGALHEWPASIAKRTGAKTGCPLCVGRRAQSST